MDSSPIEDSDAVILKDAMKIDRTVESIQNEESSNVTHPFKNPTQSKASSSDKSERGNNPELISVSNSKCSEIASSRDCINVEKIENTYYEWSWFVKILE